MKATDEVTIQILITLLLVGSYSCLSESINISNDTDIGKSTEQNNDKGNNMCEATNRRRNVEKHAEDIDDEAEESEDEEDDESYNFPKIEMRATNDRTVHRQVKRKGRQPKVWDQWGKWSCCSTSCGPGKLTRWRHCIAGGCASGQKEAQIKSCNLKSC